MSLFCADVLISIAIIDIDNLGKKQRATSSEAAMVKAVKAAKPQLR